MFINDLAVTTWFNKTFKLLNKILNFLTTNAKVKASMLLSKNAFVFYL